MKKGFTLLMLAMIIFPASLWGLAWFFSSAEVAREFCQGDFSLFHEHMRCRKPYLALLVSVIAAIISFVILGWGSKTIKKHGKNNE